MLLLSAWRKLKAVADSIHECLAEMIRIMREQPRFRDEAIGWIRRIREAPSIEDAAGAFVKIMAAGMHAFNVGREQKFVDCQWCETPIAPLRETVCDKCAAIICTHCAETYCAKCAQQISFPDGYIPHAPGCACSICTRRRAAYERRRGNGGAS